MKENDGKKVSLSVISAQSLRELVSKVNANNQAALSSEDVELIEKEDIVQIFKDNETYFLFYYR